MSQNPPFTQYATAHMVAAPTNVPTRPRVEVGIRSMMLMSVVGSAREVSAQGELPTGNITIPARGTDDG